MSDSLFFVLIRRADRVFLTGILFISLLYNSAFLFLPFILSLSLLWFWHWLIFWCWSGWSILRRFFLFFCFVRPILYTILGLPFHCHFSCPELLFLPTWFFIPVSVSGSFITYHVLVKMKLFCSTWNYCLRHSFVLSCSE